MNRRLYVPLLALVMASVPTVTLPPSVRAADSTRWGSSGVDMGAHNRLEAGRRHRRNKIARRSRRRNLR